MTDGQDRQPPDDGFTLIDDVEDLEEQLSASRPSPEAVDVTEVDNISLCGETVGKNAEEPDDRDETVGVSDDK
jgi:hypothetical protein